MKLNQKGMIGHVEILAIVLVVSMMGFTGWRIMSARQDSKQASQNSAETVELQEALPENLDGIMTVEQIQEKASAATDSAISGIELEFEDGKTIYVVHLADGSIIAYDAVTGEVVTFSDDNDDDISDDDQIPAGFVAKVSIQDAINKAKAQRPGSTVEKVEIEVEDDKVVYSVRFTDDSRVDIDASSGDVARIKVEDEEDRKSEDSKDEDSDENSNDDSTESRSAEDSDDSIDDSSDDDSRDDADDDNSGSGSDDNEDEVEDKEDDDEEDSN